MKRDTYPTECWMAVVIFVIACLQITSGWSVLRTLQGQTDGAYTANIPVHETETTELQSLQEQGAHQDFDQMQMKDIEDEEEIIVDIDGEGPLSDIQIQILRVLLRRYLEDGHESSEIMVSDLVKQVEKRVARQEHYDDKKDKNRGGRRNRSSEQGRRRPQPRQCTFEVSVPMTYEGRCRTMGRPPALQIPACDFGGNDTHPDAMMMLWAYDCI